MKKIAQENIYLSGYSSADRFCQEYRMPFEGFTELQMFVLQKKQFWEGWQNLIIKGMPGSGKTLLAEIAYLSISQKRADVSRKVLYLLPYRALLNEKYDYFLKRYDRMYYRIYRSSSDYCDNDEKIIEGDCEIAIMIYEKLDNALRMSRDETRIFYNYDLIVMDEFSLISSLDRGIIVNSILWHHAELPECEGDRKKARIIALTVPDCRTAEYNQLGFLTISNDTRPVKLYEAIVQADDGMVIPRDTRQNWPIAYEKLTTAVFSDRKHEADSREEVSAEQKFEYYENKELLPYLIKAHRKKNHHIIIFCSSRENSKNICISISKMIRKSNMSHGDWSERLTSIQKNMGDNSYGCIDNKIIESARYGVTYHNSDLPAELRREIEKEFCKPKDSRIDIIVSTETLAYGINCSADVVIIYERIKPTTEDDFPNFRYGSDLYMRYLNSVEYQNFVGRAGRLGYGESQQERCGYAYLFSKDYFGTKKVRMNYYSDNGRRFRSCRQLFAMKLWCKPVTTTAAVFDQIQINSKSGFVYGDLIDAIKALSGKRNLVQEEKIVPILIKEMKRLQLIEESEDKAGEYILTRIGVAVHGAHIPHEVLCGLGQIMDDIFRNGFSQFFLLFQICEFVRNVNLCYINRKSEYIAELSENISSFLGAMEEKHEKNVRHKKTLWNFVKLIKNNIDALEYNQNGYAYISEEFSNSLHQFHNAAILYLWTEGCSIEKINKEYKLHAGFGAINNLDRNVAHIFDCLIRCLASYVEGAVFAKQAFELKMMLKFGMPYCCVEALNFQMEPSIRPEICELIAKMGLEKSVEIIRKEVKLNSINDSSSLTQIKAMRVAIRCWLKEERNGRNEGKKRFDDKENNGFKNEF